MSIISNKECYNNATYSHEIKKEIRIWYVECVEQGTTMREIALSGDSVPFVKMKDITHKVVRMPEDALFVIATTMMLVTVLIESIKIRGILKYAITKSLGYS